MEKIKFVYIHRTICPKTGVHFLDAICTEGFHWTAQQVTNREPWITYKEIWKKDPQQPW